MNTEERRNVLGMNDIGDHELLFLAKLKQLQKQTKYILSFIYTLDLEKILPTLEQKVLFEKMHHNLKLFSYRTDEFIDTNPSFLELTSEFENSLREDII
jgi:hypothetical protein